MPHRPGPPDEEASHQFPHATRVLLLLALINVVNFYDRTVPAVVIEPVRAEFGLDDVQIGILGASFTVVYALAGVALGRLADRRSRRLVMVLGLVLWTVFTAASAGAWSFMSLLLFRVGVGIGEASYGPAATSVVFDAFPPGRRSRAVAIFQFGVPLGLLLAFLTTGWIVEVSDSWRVPFLVAAVPGLVLVAALMRVPLPRQGASDLEPTRVTGGGPHPVWSILQVPTVRWIIVGGVGIQVPTYAAATFLVPLLQRYFGLGIAAASISAGLVIGVTGVLGLLLGGALADRAARRSLRHRLVVGAVGAVVAAPVVASAFVLGPESAVLFTAILGFGWLFSTFFGTASMPALADVVPPGQRATAVAVVWAAFYLLGGAFGPIVAGALSEAFAVADPARGLSAEAVGLHTALLVILPAGLLVCALGTWAASRRVEADHAAIVAASGAGRDTAQA